MQLEAPIIIIGAGRSGSTLLDRMLDAHPDIHMLGETNFIVATVWESMLAAREKTLIAIDDSDLLHQRLVGIGKVANDVLGKMFALDELTKSRWGIKEIWNGDKAKVDWAIYDLVFPDAVWVHLVRNPLDYARSAISWNGLDMTEEQLAIKFRKWLAMVDVARERMSTGRFVEVRYEDLVENPAVALGPLFRKLGLSYSDSCLAPLSHSWVSSKSAPQMPAVAIDRLVAETGTKERLDELGYEILEQEGVPQISRQGQRDIAVSGTTEQGHAGGPMPGPHRCEAFGGIAPTKGIILDPSKMSQEIGLAVRFWAPLLIKECDDSDHPNRSTHLMLEDGKPIGSPHSTHSDIREKGNGRWSHWGQNIIFSSSDGTDPRQNGREYALMKPRQESQARDGDS